MVQRDLIELYQKGLLSAVTIFAADQELTSWGICCEAVDGQIITMTKDRGSQRINENQIRLFSTIGTAYRTASRIGFKQMQLTEKVPNRRKVGTPHPKDVVINKPARRRNHTPDLLTEVAFSA